MSNIHISLCCLIKNKFHNLVTEQFHINFQQAVHNNVKSVFPKAAIKECNFHFNQTIWHRMQVLEFLNWKEIGKYIRMCAALAHLQYEFINESWLFVMSVTSTYKARKEFNGYFVNQWLNKENRCLVCYKEKRHTRK